MKPETPLHIELSQRFPEIRDRIQDDAGLPYLLMGKLAGWIAEISPQELTQELVSRVVMFTKWCEEQPRSGDATDDLFTILVVAFYEKLFDSDTTRSLLPKLIRREDMVANADYLKSWVGEENYNKALKQYGSND
jgi:hypothetical protein